MYENFSKKELDTAGDEIKIYKSDIDYNKHVNAGVYVRWVSDAIHLPDENLKEMEVYYGSQVYFGQNVISKIKKVSEHRLSDPYEQRYHFWSSYAKAKESNA